LKYKIRDPAKEWKTMFSKKKIMATISSTITSPNGFYSTAALLGHDRAELETGKEIHSTISVTEPDELRRLLCRADKRSRAKRGLTFFTEEMIAREDTLWGLWDRLEAYLFADGELSFEDGMLIQAGFPWKVLAISSLEKRLPADYCWELDREVEAIVMNYGNLVMERNSCIRIVNSLFCLMAQNLTLNGEMDGDSSNSRYDFGIFGADGFNGKQGVDGAPGNEGTSGRDGTCMGNEMSPENDGGPGLPGGDGGPGAIGGNGIHGFMNQRAELNFYRINKTSNELRIMVRGGNGGNGAQGGRGGDGGKGGRGGKGAICGKGCTKSGIGGRGGRGGNGGPGGNGGNGGSVKPIYVSVPDHAPSIVRLTPVSIPGKGGLGGQAGTPGEGGPGGEAIGKCKAGSGGPSGTPGMNGMNGKNGEKLGAPGKIYINDEL
jgi:hypothetical protein